MPPRWLVRVIEEVRRCGLTRAVDFTAKAVTGEPMYVFEPHVAGVSLYIKIVLRQRCVVISFHEREAAEDDGDT